MLLIIPFNQTYLQVLNSDKAPTSTHYMVVRTEGAHGKRTVLFNYEASRTVAALKNLCIGPNGPYRGKLLSDWLDLYYSMVEELGLRHFGCLAHCRQHFAKAGKVSELRSGRSLAGVAFENFLNPVYVIVRKVKALRKAGEPGGIVPRAEILAVRQKAAAHDAGVQTMDRRSAARPASKDRVAQGSGVHHSAVGKLF